MIKDVLRCRSCSKKGRLNHKWKGIVKKDNCICGKLKDKRAKKCRECWLKKIQEGMFCLDCGKKLWTKSTIYCRKCWNDIGFILNDILSPTKVGSFQRR